MAIRKLPEEVRSAVRSGIAISSTAQCITELVLNSLDAGANSIIVRLDIPHFKLEVDDNGCGITHDDLCYVGCRYFTSKCRTIQDLQSNLKYNGYRGEVLASISEYCGFLVIVTRPKHLEADNTYLKAFTRGKASKPIKSPAKRKNFGTTITVQDFMCNAPVRQKRIVPNVDIEEIRIQVEGLALSYPHVSFTIIDDSDKSIIRQISSTSTSLETFTQLYGPDISKSLCPIGPFTSGKLNIRGFISTDSHHNKRLQFIFVNGRLVKGTKIHKLINMIMRKSDVLRGNGPWQELPMPERMRDFLWVSPLKKKDRYCIFMVHISCPVSEYDITLDPKKTLIEFCDWDTLFESMENVVKTFLKEHNLACIAPDQGLTNSQSSDDSPLSLLNEMEQLEKEDALGQRLSQFKCPRETLRALGDAKAFGDKTLDMPRAIHSIPAKRNLSNLWAVSSEQQPAKNEEIKGKICENDECDVGCDEEQLVCKKSQISKFRKEVIAAEEIQLIKYPLLPENNNPDVTPVNSVNKNEEISLRFKLQSTIMDSGIGSLGRFRRLFKKNPVLYQRTPDDVQKIIVEEPPPIVRRPAPLEHRIKDSTSQKKFNDIDFNTIKTLTNAAENEGIHKQESFASNHLKKFAFHKTLTNSISTGNGSAQKGIFNSDTFTCAEEVLNCGDTLPSAMQPESTLIEEMEHTSENKTQATEKRLHKPNLKSLNLRRRQFEETVGYHNKIKVYKYDDMNKIPDNEMQMKEIGSGLHHCTGSQSDKYSFVSKRYEPQKQIQTITDLVHRTEKAFMERNQHDYQGGKPNIKNINLRRRNFEGTSSSSHRIQLDKYGKKKNLEKEVIVKASQNDPYQSQKDVFNKCSLLVTTEKSKIQNMEIKFITSEDFICSLKKGKEASESKPSRLKEHDRSTITKFYVPSGHLEDNVHIPVSIDDEQISEGMPVLEPHFSTPDFNSLSEPNNLNESPPQLSISKNYSSPVDSELECEFSSPMSLPTYNITEKTDLDSSVTEQNRKKLRGLSSSPQGSLWGKCERLSRPHCQSLAESDRNGCFQNLSSTISSNCHKINELKSQSLVPMYDSETDDDACMIDGLNLLHYDSECFPSKVCSNEEGLVNPKVHISNNKNREITEIASLNPDNCSDKVLKSPSGATNGQSMHGSDSITVQSKQPTHEVIDTYLDFGKRQHANESTSNFEEKVDTLISASELLQNHEPESNQRIVSSAEGEAISTNILLDGHGETKISPFFVDSSDWDAALVEMCQDLEHDKRNENQNSKSGNSLNENDGEGCQQRKKFVMFARQPFFPKGLSPVMPLNLQNNLMKNRNNSCHLLSSQEGNDLDSAIKQSSDSANELAWVKWGNSNAGYPMKEYPQGAVTEQDKRSTHILSSILSATEDKKLIAEREILSARIENQTKSFVRVFKLLHPCTFSKEMLKNSKMIGKLDSKFIVAKVNLENEKFSNAVVLFDQHAVHERIRLERLTQEYQVNDGVVGDSSKGFRYKSVSAVPTFEIFLNASEARLMESFHENFERLGLAFDVHSGHGNGNDDSVIEITEIPVCLLSKELKESGPLGLKEQVRSLIREQVEDLLVTRGLGTFSPNILRDAINMKACRGAVKFGDSLSNQECRWLLRKLSACDIPFQCAHGRPSMYPIIELKQLERFYNKNEEDCKPRLWRLRKMMEYAAAH